MTYTLDAFVKEPRPRSSNTGPAGREKVRVLLEKLLTNKGFVDEAVGPQHRWARASSTRTRSSASSCWPTAIAKPHKSPPHDHGPRGRSTARRSSTPT